MPHTPGPWKAKQFDDAQILILGPGNKTRELVCTCTGVHKEDNAQLIATLPDLLQAAIELIEELQAAISKAKETKP